MFPTPEMVWAIGAALVMPAVAWFGYRSSKRLGLCTVEHRWEILRDWLIAGVALGLAWPLALAAAAGFAAIFAAFWTVYATLKIVSKMLIPGSPRDGQDDE